MDRIDVLSRCHATFFAARHFSFYRNLPFRRSKGQYFFGQQSLSKGFEKGPDPHFFHTAKESRFLDPRLIVDINQLDPVAIDMGHGILIAGDDVNPIRSVDVGYVGMGEDFTGILKSLVGGQFPETGKARSPRNETCIGLRSG